jgi:hypothetical protein
MIAARVHWHWWYIFAFDGRCQAMPMVQIPGYYRSAYLNFINEFWKELIDDPIYIWVLSDDQTFDLMQQELEYREKISAPRPRWATK